MGNCCKKKQKNLTDKISLSSKNSSNNKNRKLTEKIVVNQSINKIDKLRLRENDSKEPFSKYYNIREINNDLSQSDKKKLEEYKIILKNYFEFREIIEKKCKENIYIVNYNDTINLISLYNELKNKIGNEENSDAEKIINDKLNEFIINKNTIKAKFKTLNFKECKKLINKEQDDAKIDLLNKDLCELLKVKGENATYINNNDNNQFRYLNFKNNKTIKIRITSGIFYLKEILEENYSILEVNSEREKIKNSSKSIKNEEKNVEVKNSIIEKIEEEKIENDIIYIPLEILFLYNAQKKEIKSKEIYYLCNKNIINHLIEEIKNYSINEKGINELIISFLAKGNYTNFIDIFEKIKIIIKKFKKENLNLFGNNYNFNNLDKKNFLLEQNDIEYNGENIKNIPSDFIFIKQEIYELLLKFYNLEQKEEIDEIFNKFDLLKVLDENIMINIYETNTIYICKAENNNKIVYYNVFIILSYISKEIYLKEIILLEKNNFDVELYLQEKNININKYFQKIYDENYIDIGYFINLNQPKIEEQKEELIEENKENEQKEEIIEENKEDIKEEKKEELIEETHEETKEKKKEELIDETKDIEKEEQKNEIIEENKVIDKAEDEIENPPKQIGLLCTNSNTYLNSVIHCIYSIPELTNFFISDKNLLNLTEDSFSNEENIIINNIVITKDSFSFKYIEILFYLYHKKKNNKYIHQYSPKNILEFIQTQKPNIFQKNIESNPKEFLNYLIKKLREELKEEENIKSLENAENLNLMDSVNENEETLYNKYLSDFKFKNNSIIDKYLAGIELISFTCDKCKEQQKNFINFYNLEFPLLKIEKNLINSGTTFDKIGLDECFKYYFKNHITSQNCKKCENNNNNTITQKIFLAPKIMVIYIGNIREKKDLFELDEEINLNEYLKDKNDGYKLIAIVVLYAQTGSSDRYYSYRYNNEDKKWYCFVDEYIYEVNDDLKNEIQKSNRLPYILFYKEKSLFN